MKYDVKHHENIERLKKIAMLSERHLEEEDEDNNNTEEV